MERPNFHLKQFWHTHSLYEPCFHFNSPIFTKVSLWHTLFPKVPFSFQNVQISSKSLKHTDFLQKPCFTPVAPCAESFFLKAPILPKRPNFHLKQFWHTHFPYEPCFHLNSPIFIKVSLSHTHFPQKPNFLPKCPFSTLISTKALF